MLEQEALEVPSNPLELAKRQVQGGLPPPKKIKSVDLACAWATDPLMVEALVDLGSQPAAATPKASATKAKTQTLPPEGPTCTATANQAGPFVSKAFGKLYVTRAAQRSYIQIDIWQEDLVCCYVCWCFP